MIGLCSRRYLSDLPPNSDGSIRTLLVDGTAARYQARCKIQSRSMTLAYSIGIKVIERQARRRLPFCCQYSPN